MTQAVMLHAPAFCRVGSLTRPDLFLFAGRPVDLKACVPTWGNGRKYGAPGRGPEPGRRQSSVPAMKSEGVLLMYLEADEVSMVPVMVVRVPVMPEKEKSKLREKTMSGIFDGLLLLEDGLSYEVVELPLPRAWTPELLEPEAPPEPNPEAKEKREILARLQAHRKANGLGCFGPLAKVCGKGITATTLRNMLNGDEVYPIDTWRKVGRGLDKLGGTGPKESGG